MNKLLTIHQNDIYKRWFKCCIFSSWSQLWAWHTPMSDVSIVIMSHVTSLCPGPQVSLSLDSAVGSPERDSFTFQS